MPKIISNFFKKIQSVPSLGETMTRYVWNFDRSHLNLELSLFPSLLFFSSPLFVTSVGWSRSESPKEFVDIATDGQSKVVADAGSDVLYKFQKSWSHLHSNSSENVTKLNEANDLYSSIVSNTVKCQNVFNSFEELLGTGNIFNEIYKLIDCIEGDLKMSSELFLQLEEILNFKEEECFRNEMRKKFDVKYYLNIYEQQQGRSFEQMKKLLHQEMLRRQHERETLETLKLRERQETFQREFEQQLQLYKQNGQIVKRSNSPGESSSIALEDISIEPDEDDKVNLEKFLKDE